MELIGLLFPAAMPVIASAFGVIVADHPFALHDVDEGVFVAVRFIRALRYAPYLDLAKRAVLVILFLVIQELSLHGATHNVGNTIPYIRVSVNALVRSS